MGQSNYDLFILLFVFLLLCIGMATYFSGTNPSIQTISLTSDKEQVWPTRIYPVNNMYPTAPHGPPVHSHLHPY